MTQKELNERIAQHKLWLDTDGKEGDRFVAYERHLRGVSLVDADLRCASLQGADLRDANLLGARLSYADLSGADLSGADLSGADLRHADLFKADIQRVNLQHADFSHSCLCGSDIDYSSWPLSFGSLDVKVDTSIARQIAYHFCPYHFCRLDCDDPEYIRLRNEMIDFANGFHRVKEYGKLDKMEV